MKIKTFRALTMQEALRAIKTELGPEAVILSTKRVRHGGRLFGMFGRSMIEVAAAIDPGNIGKDRASGSRRSPSGEHGFDDLLRLSLKRPSVQEGATFERSDPMPSKDPEPARHTPVEWREILNELRDIRRILTEAPARLERNKRLDLTDILSSWCQDLIGAGLTCATAERMVEEVRQRLEESSLASPAAVRQVLSRVLADHVHVAGPLLQPDERRKTVIFVGPTGVGKTTTIAKLAAHYRLQERRKVALITLDTYRLAAVEQLRMYAHLIGLTVDVALTRREAAECIRRQSQADLILIDTAGRSPRDAAGMEELKEMITLDPPCEVHLVLSAATRERDLRDGVTSYAGIPISRLLFTKLDETTSFGGLFDLGCRTGLALSYFSTGQRVPEDLEVVRPELVAALVLGDDVRQPAFTRAGRSAGEPRKGEG